MNEDILDQNKEIARRSTKNAGIRARWNGWNSTCEDCRYHDPAFQR